MNKTEITIIFITLALLTVAVLSATGTEPAEQFDADTIVLQRLVNKYDLNSDGRIDMLDFAEFTQGYSQAQAIYKARREAMTPKNIVKPKETKVSIDPNFFDDPNFIDFFMSEQD